jgi:hypothetical protein
MVYRNYEEQQAAIDHHIHWRNGTRVISLENWKLYRRAQKKMA